MRVMENVSFYCPNVGFYCRFKEHIVFNLEKYSNKKPLVAFSFEVLVLIVNSIELCWGLFSSR